MTALGQLRVTVKERLKKAGVENYHQEADWILCRLLNYTRAELLAHPEATVTQAQREQLDETVARRTAGEPLQYILEETSFWGRPFSVHQGVLIPRPETEEVVETALEYLRQDTQQTFLDWGTGSGCIAITIMMERPLCQAVMAEKNPLSLMEAWRNLKRYGLLPRALLWHTQHPEDIHLPHGPVDLVVANPPYIPTAELSKLMPVVKNYEPMLALDGGGDGMNFYRQLLKSATIWLRQRGTLVMEIGDENQAAFLRETEFQGMSMIKEKKDISGHTRCMVWEYSGPQ